MSIVADFAGLIRKSPFLSRLSLKCTPDWTIHVNVPEVGRMRVRMRRNRSYWLRSPLCHEWYPLSALKHFVRPGDTVWDVGANVGLYSRILAQSFGADSIVAFEPMAENRPILTHNLQLGGVADKVHVMRCALGNMDGETDFQTDDVQSASGTLNAVTNGGACVAREMIGLPPIVEKVLCRTIDSLVQSGEIPAPQVLKIDVEGAERLLLDGGKKYLKEAETRILIETHGIDVSKQCLEFLFDAGYFVAACSTNDPWQYRRLTRDSIPMIINRYDAHFIVASKQDNDLDIPIEYNAVKLLKSCSTKI